MTDYTLPRGTRDILPDEIDIWHFIETTALNLFEGYNYQEIRTPIFESTELFTRGLGNDTDIVSKEMYTFTDKGDRQLTLRPEGTAPVVRAAIQNQLVTPAYPTKLWYKGPMFRYERPQAGRYRQFHQIGVEHLGSAHPCTDAEVIGMGVRLFDKLGLKNLRVKINSVGCKICRTVIEERLKQFLEKSLPHLCEDCNRRFYHNPLRILDCKNTTCNTYFSGLPDIRLSLCRECKDHFDFVLEYLEILEIKFTVDPRLVRGLDYYTKTTFEILSDELGAQNAVCGGGRYDSLIGQLGGKETPAVGFAFGMERAVMLLQKLQKSFTKRSPLFVLAPIGFSQRPLCFSLLDQLRQSGIRCDMNFTKEDLSSHLKHANRVGAQYTVIIGEKEAESKIARLKNMKTGEQEDIKLTRLRPYLMKLCLL